MSLREGELRLAERMEERGSEASDENGSASGPGLS
jgi:hypothetical protein